jgi:hypothetical protein
MGSRRPLQERDEARWQDERRAAGLASTISAMIPDGVIELHDVPRCVFWAKAKAPAGCHEAALAELERGTRQIAARQFGDAFGHSASQRSGPPSDV